MTFDVKSSVVGLKSIVPLVSHVIFSDVVSELELKSHTPYWETKITLSSGNILSFQK